MSGSVVTQAMTADQFRGLYPEFSDTTAYTDIAVNDWLLTGSGQLDPVRWGGMYTKGVALFAAHFLAVGRRNGTQGAQPGSAGLQNQKMVGKASVGYDTLSTTVKDAGHWNLTTYGTMFISFAQMFGSGGQQIGGPFLGPTFPLDNSGSQFPWVA